MAGVGLGAIRRLWLEDSRSEHRRMAVSVHPEEGVAVFSVWSDSLCRASFRIPLAELPRLIALLSSPVEWTSDAERTAGAGTEPLWLVQ